MTETIVSPDLKKADSQLAELFKGVQDLEGNLAGGKLLELTLENNLSESGKLKTGAKAVASLFETRVSFGDPRDRLAVHLSLSQTAVRTTNPIHARASEANGSPLEQPCASIS